MDADAEGSEFAGGRAKSGGVSSADGDGGAKRCETERNRPADTAIAAGNQCGFVCERLAGIRIGSVIVVHAKSSFLRPRFLCQAHLILKNSLRRTGSGDRAQWVQILRTDEEQSERF